MTVKESHSTDHGKITQINYTEKRSDGKTETRHLNPDTGKYTGKSVSDKSGRTEYYDREESGLGSCCYITTACLKALNLPQDSLEFKAMKTLTKEHILKTISGKRDYILYNRISPGIVEKIESKADSKEIWKKVYERLREIALLVSDKKYEEGHQSYKSLVVELNGCL